MIVTITNANMLDTESMELIGERTIVLEDDAIVDVVDGVSSVDADLNINAAGKFVMPGFIDAHVHHFIVTMDFPRMARMSTIEVGIAMANLSSATVQRGFTTVRDTGGDVAPLIRAIETGLCDGPRIVRAGRILSQTGGTRGFPPT